MEKEVFEFLQNQKPQLCVMATIGPNDQPESAVLAYIVHDDLSITISTHNPSRKWENISNKNKVALVFGWDFTNPNVQYEGLAQRIEQESDHNWHEEVYFRQHPELKRFQSPTTVFIKIIPTWIRFTDYSTQPPKVLEKTYIPL